MKTLKETATMMDSADYKERFAAEYYQLEIRLHLLEAMVYDLDKGELNFVPTCPRATYDFQIRAMKDYLGILQIRAKMEGVELRP